MSKQDIEKRLGFAAQGVKETTRTSAKAEMGFLSRVGYAATALTADPADPKSPEYRKQVSEAKAAAKDAITNYKFMRDKVKERLAALDAYVTNAIKVINSATSAKDIEHYVEQLRIAVKSQSMILGASKSPFSRAGAKAKFGLSPSEMKENQRRIETNIRYEAGVIRDVSSNMRFIKDEIQRLTAEIKNTRDIKRKAQLSLKLDAENKKMKDQVAYLRRARQMIQENQADAKSLGITLDAKWSGNFARPGVKAKFADAALDQIRNNAAISDKILTLVSKGLSVPQAIDSVLGEGTYKRIGSEVYDELKKAKSSRPGAKAKA